MITLSFTAQRKVVRFVIKDRVVHYFDDMWKEGIQILPLDKKLVRRLLKAREPSLKATGLLIFDANKGKNKKEYGACGSEEEICEMIRQDCKKKGLLEIQ